MERSTIYTLAKRGQSQRSIARLMGVSRNTVARSLTEPVDRRPLRRGRKSTVDEYRPQIEEWLEQGLSVVRMLELARADDDHPYRGGHVVIPEKTPVNTRVLKDYLHSKSIGSSGSLLHRLLAHFLTGVYKRGRRIFRSSRPRGLLCSPTCRPVRRMLACDVQLCR